jgi:outer membrane protein TolC
LLLCAHSWGDSNAVAHDDLEALVAEALRHNPGILAVEWQLRQALAGHDAVAEGFWDPQMTATLGKGEHQNSLSTGDVISDLTDDASVLQGGVQPRVFMKNRSSPNGAALCGSVWRRPSGFA